MSAQNEIQITFHNSLPKVWMEEYSADLEAERFSVIIKQYKDDGFCNFSGKEIYDLLVSIPGNSFKLISETIFELVLSESFKSLWKKIIHAKSKNAKCRLRLHAEGKEINVEIAGTIDDKIIVGAIEALSKGLLDQNAVSYFSHSDFLEPTDKPKIRLSYNVETLQWEPVNYGERRTAAEEILKRAHQTLSD